MPANIGGFVKPGFEPVMEVYRKNIEAKVDKGSCFAVYYKGDLVVDIWGGVRNSQTGALWQEDTLSTFYSVTKACTAFVIAQLVERGLLNYDEKISKYWKEFGQNGKENITLKQLVTHQAGLANLDEPFNIADLRDDFDNLCGKLERQKPMWEVGTGFGYHPLTFALYLDALVRKVDRKHRTLSQYFHEEFAKPLGGEFYIGLPPEYVDRTTRIEMLQETPIDMEALLAYLYMAGDKKVVDQYFASKNPQDMQDIDSMNQGKNRQVGCGSSHGHGTARGLARIYSAIINLEPVSNGQPLLSKESVKLLHTPLVQGSDKCFGLSAQLAVGTVVTQVVEDGDFEHSLQVFGHGGHGGQIGLGDSRYKVGLAYSSPYMSSSLTNQDDDPRSDPLIDTTYECIYKLENINKSRVIYKRYADYLQKKEEAKTKNK